MFRPSHLAVAFAVWTAATAGIGAQSSPRPPLIVEFARVVEAGLEVVFFNPGEVRVVGWAIRGMFTYADGSSRPLGFAVDAYEDTLLPIPDTSMVDPGARRSVILRTDVPARAQLVGVSVVPTMVILENDQAVGDEPQIAFFFDRRAENRRVWLEVARLLAEQSGSAPNSIGQLEDLDTRVDRVGDETLRQTITFRIFRKALTAARRLSGGDNDKARDQLEWLLRQSALRLRAAELHVTRRM